MSHTRTLAVVLIGWGAVPLAVHADDIGLILKKGGPEGVEVLSAAPNSLAGQLKLKYGDVILRINGKSVATQTEVTKALFRSEKFTMTYRREGAENQLEATVYWPPRQLPELPQQQLQPVLPNMDLIRAEKMIATIPRGEDRLLPIVLHTSPPLK